MRTNLPGETTDAAVAAPRGSRHRSPAVLAGAGRNAVGPGTGGVVLPGPAPSRRRIIRGCEMSERPIGITAPLPLPGYFFPRGRGMKVATAAGRGISPAADIVTTLAADARAAPRTGCAGPAEG